VLDYELTSVSVSNAEKDYSLNSDVKKEVYHLTRIASSESICGSCWNKGRLLKNQSRIICFFIVFIEIQPFYCFRWKMCKKLEKWDPLKYNLEPMAIRVKTLFAYVDPIEVDINRKLNVWPGSIQPIINYK